MSTRRQQKVARVVKEAVSDAIANHLGDPRIRGFVSVTRVDVAPNLRNADVYLSILARVQDQDAAKQTDKSLTAQKLTFSAITHAKSRIQSLLAGKMRATKFCPVLHFHQDESFRKTLETMELINRVAGELAEPEEPGPDVDKV